MRVVTPGEMARIDRAMIEDEGIPGLTLMENAGEAVARVAMDILSREGGGTVAIWCGKGNNGGDGLVVARLLSGAGVDVTVFLLADPEELSPDARTNLERLSGLTVEVVRVSEDGGLERFEGMAPRPTLVLDAIFGTGFSGRARGIFEAAIGSINSAGCPVLAVDIPSGVSGETGEVAGAAVRADRTVTLAAVKVGLVQYPGAGLAGSMEVAGIGIPRRLIDSVPKSRIYLTNGEDALALLPRRAPDAHKWQSGSVLVIGGSPGMSGAVAMCARACLRAGAGIVTAGVPEGLGGILEVKLTEVMTRPLPQTPRGALSLESANEITELSRRFDVLALGPGMSGDPQAAQLVRELVKTVEKPVILDADGLNAMAGHSRVMEEREPPLVLTPHPGEMARLVGGSSAEVQADRVAIATDAAARWGAVVVLKGAGTVIAEPGGIVNINATGNPGMATAGMGDVLTGCIAALMAQGLGAFEAAVAGAYCHGYAADLAAQMDAMIGLVAGDVIRHLPLAMRRPE
ncbi:MAG: NAD(P)H-hydrate dehydratase [Actinobacteria bacterium]|nr:NAD(P)H-hydrate dehydratase [Actinomycetota bacterium]